MNHVKITSPDITGINTEIEVDGKKLRYVTRIDIQIRVNEANRLTVDQFFAPGEIEGEFDIDQAFVFADRPGTRYRLVEVPDA